MNCERATAMNSDSNESTDPPSDAARVEQFLRLFSMHRQRLFQYILALLPNLHDAEDVLQETNVILWRKFGEYQEGTNFAGWAMRIAHFEILKHRRRQARGGKPVLLDERVLETLAVEAGANVSVLEAASNALEHCLRKLSKEDQALLRATYAASEKITEVAARLQRPVNSVYKSLGRIRQALLACVKRGVRLAEWPGGELT